MPKGKHGRPPLDPASRATSRIVVRLTAEQRRDVERVAQRKHTTVAGVLREAITVYAEDYGERVSFLRRK